MNVKFENVAAHFAQTDTETLGALVANAFDLAFVVGADRRIENVTFNENIASMNIVADWKGQALTDVLPGPEMEILLERVGDASVRENSAVLSLKSDSGTTSKVKFTAIRAEPTESILLLGQDVTQMVAMQGRILEMHQSMDAQIDQRKQIEAQYRTLFAISAEPILILDAKSGRIADANAAAAKILRTDKVRLTGSSFLSLLEKPFRQSVSSLVNDVQKTGASQSISVQLTTGLETDIVASLSWGKSNKILLQFGQANHDANRNEEFRSLEELVRAANEAIVVVDEGCQIKWANASFNDLALSSMPMVQGTQNLKSFFDIADLDLETMISILKKSGRMNLVPTSLRTNRGELVDVELSAVTIPNVTPLQFGFFIRNTSMRLSQLEASAEPFVKVSSILNRLGTAPYRDLMRDEMDEIEKKVLSATLELTGNNRAATAKILGMSRQTLYQKLNRFNFDDE